MANPAKRKVLHIHWPTFDLSKKGDLFTQFTNLEELTLHFDGNYTYGFPEEIGQITSLKKLLILNYPFTEFPLWVFDLTNLEDLTIRGNAIKVIPSGIEQLRALKRLRIEKTLLENLPPDLQQLTSLQSLSLIDNFKLKQLNPAHLPPNLNEIVLTPSSISEENRHVIKQMRPELRMK